MVEAGPAIQVQRQQEQADGGGQVTPTYTLKELREFSEFFQQKSGEDILAWILRAWDTGAASIHLSVSEKDLLSPITHDDQIQRGYVQLQNIRDPDGQDIIASTLYQWLCAAVLTAYAKPVELVLFLGKWSTTEEGIHLVRQMGMAHALIMGSNPDRVTVTRVMKMRLLRGAPASLAPLITPAVINVTSNAGALANILSEIGAVALEPSVWVSDQGKPAKPKGVCHR